MNTLPLVLAASVAIAPFILQLMPLLTTGVAYGLTAGVKALLPKIPGWLLPIIASVVGALGDTALHFSAGTEANTLNAALLGLAATGAHQIRRQMQPPDPLGR
jgi:hypothetical protein